MRMPTPTCVATWRASWIALCEGEPYYEHTLEGLDDMPAHAKSSLFGVSITIPISAHRLALGTWQGIYLCEFRDSGGSRSIVATVMGE